MMMLVTVMLLQVMEVEEEEEDESEEVMRVFRPLQLLTACFGALRYILIEMCDLWKQNDLATVISFITKAAEKVF